MRLTARPESEMLQGFLPANAIPAAYPGGRFSSIVSKF